MNSYNWSSRVGPEISTIYVDMSNGVAIMWILFKQPYQGFKDAASLSYIEHNIEADVLVFWSYNIFTPVLWFPWALSAGIVC